MELALGSLQNGTHRQHLRLTSSLVRSAHSTHRALLTLPEHSRMPPPVEFDLGETGRRDY